MNHHHIEFTWNLDTETPLSFLLSKFELIAGIHAAKLGVGIEELLKDNKSWVMLGMNIKTIRQPKIDEALTLKTWPSEIIRFFTFRDFQVLNAQNEVLIEARTQWVLLDMVRRRPLPIPGHLNDFVKDAPKVFDFLKVGNIKQVAFEHSDSFVANASHTDINEHVNNKFYIEWAYKALSHRDQTILPKSVIVEFLKESFVGDDISVDVGKDEASSSLARVTSKDNILFTGKFS